MFPLRLPWRLLPGVIHYQPQSLPHLLRVLATRQFAFAAPGVGLDIVRTAFLRHLAWGSYPTPGYTQERRKLLLLLAEAASPAARPPPPVGAASGPQHAL